MAQRVREARCIHANVAAVDIREVELSRPAWGACAENTVLSVPLVSRHRLPVGDRLRSCTGSRRSVGSAAMPMNRGLLSCSGASVSSCGARPVAGVEGVLPGTPRPRRLQLGRRFTVATDFRAVCGKAGAEVKGRLAFWVRSCREVEGRLAFWVRSCTEVKGRSTLLG